LASWHVAPLSLPLLSPFPSLSCGLTGCTAFHTVYSLLSRLGRPPGWQR
jgi:hypothetical protein